MAFPVLGFKPVYQNGLLILRVNICLPRHIFLVLSIKSEVFAWDPVLLRHVSVVIVPRGQRIFHLKVFVLLDHKGFFV